MRKYFYIFLCASLTLTGISSQAFAATMFDTEGSYGVAIAYKIKVKKEAGNKSFSVGRCDIAASTATTGTFSLDDLAVPDMVSGISTIVTGTLTMLKGKKVLFRVDKGGIDAISATIFYWLVNLAEAEGITIFSATVTIFLPIKTNAFKVDKNTGRPKGKAKLKFKGRIDADTSVGFLSRAIKSQTIVEF